MSELLTRHNIAALIARPSEQMNGEVVHGVKNAVARLAEAQLYDDVACAMRRDPHSAHDLLLRQAEENPDAEFAFPKVRVALLEACVERMKMVEATWDAMAEVAAGGPLDKAREAAWREEPGRWLPGATASDVVLLHASEFGVVRYLGREHVWIYATLTQGDDKIVALNSILDMRPEFGGILVGPSELAQEIDMPPGCVFAPIGAGLDVLAPVDPTLFDDHD